MRNNKTAHFQRIISLFLVFAMLFSGIAQSGFSFGRKNVHAQSSSPIITTSIATHEGEIDQDEVNPGETEPGETPPTDPFVTIPTVTEPPVNTPTDPEITPELPVITTPDPEITPELPVITTPDPEITPEPPVFETQQPTPEPPVFETQQPTPEPKPNGTDGIFNWIDITIEGVEGVEITAYLGTDTNLAIPATLGDPAKPVLSIGAHALQGKQLTFITLPEGLINIGAYAFTDNQLASITTPEPPQHIILPSTLKYIGEFAFRDNNLTVLDIPASVSTLGRGAFISNQLTSLTLHEGLLTIGNSAFEQNNLVEVSMPNSITTMGTDVFALNNRYVKIVTDNPLIQTEFSPKGFGHVVNPITVIIKHHDPEGNMLISDKILGADLSIPGEAFSVGVEVSYTPQEIAGYITDSPQVFTPTHDGFEYTVIYQPSNILPVITKTPILIEPGATEARIEELLREGLTATDFQGNDITDDVTWTHNINAAVSGSYTVTYSVVDQWGNEAIKQVEAVVATDWNQYPICNGWVLGDFNYSGGKITGLSASGIQKYNNGNVNLCLPEFSPTTRAKIVEISSSSFFNYVFASVDFTRVSELQIIGASAFSKSGLTHLDLSHNTKLTDINSSAFEASPLLQLNLSANHALARIGSSAFRNHNLTNIDLSQLSALTYIGMNSFRGLSVAAATLTFPTTCNLLMIDSYAFYNVNAGNLDFSNCSQLNHIGNSAFYSSTGNVLKFPENSAITYIDSSAFYKLTITELDLHFLPNLEFIGGSAFSSSKITDLDFSKTPKLTHLGGYSFSSSPLTNINFSGCDSLRYIGYSAFQAAKLTHLDLSVAQNLTYIGNDAFRNSLLASLSLPPAVQYIGNNAFYQNRLTHLDLSTVSSLKYIGSDAFRGTQALVSIEMPEACSLVYIASSAFMNAKLTGLLDFSSCKNLSYIGPSAFKNSLLQTLQFDSPTLSYIGNEAFSNSPLESLDLTKIPNINYIGENAFRSLIANSLDFSQNNALQYIGKSAFTNARLSYLDLSNNPHLKYLGSSAFQSSTLDEIWISPDAYFVVPSYGYNTHNSKLYTGLYNNDTAVFRTHNGEAVLPPDPNGERSTSGALSFMYSNKYEYSAHNAYTNSEATSDWPYSRQKIVPANLTPVGSDSNVFPSSWSSGEAGKYVVNPKDVTVYSVDAQGNTIADPYTEKTPGGNTYTVIARPIFGYCTPDPIVADLSLENPSVTFVYQDISTCYPGDTTNIHLSQSYNTPIKPGPYLIGEQMISRVKCAISGYNGTMEHPQIILYYDPEVFDETQIAIPITPDSSIIDYTAKDGVLTLNLKPIQGGLNLEVPIGWKFKKYVTPEFTPFPLDAYFLNDTRDPLAKANPVDFQGYYPDPFINKYADGKHQSGIILREFTPSRYGDPAIDDVVSEYIDFTFSVFNLERNIGTYTITDTLPVYPSMENGVESQRTAIFDPAVNPGWVLSADGKTVTYTGDAENSRRAPVPRLRLRFPWAMYYYNIENTVSGVLSPFNQSPFEDDMLVSDSIVFSFGEKLVVTNIFDKEIFKPHYQPDKAYFYDNDHERHLDMPWELYINPDVDLYNIVLSDYSLDERLYYSSAIVPEAFIGGTYHLIDVNGTIIESGQITATEFDWSQEIGLLTKRVEFHIPHLPAAFYTTILNTRLVNPDIPHFDPTPGSTSNTFWNSGSLDYALAPDEEASHHVEDREELSIRLVHMRVEPIKTQSLNNSPAVPGDAVKYEIYVKDDSVGSYHDPLNDFVMIDLMPVGLQVSSIELSSLFAECDGTYQIIQNYNGTGRVGIVFSAPSLRNPGNRFNQVATIHAVIEPTATDGDYVNEVFMDFSNTNVTNIGEKVWDQLNDPNTYSRAATQFEVWSIKEVRSYKAIRISDAYPWSFTGIETPAGSQFEYALNILNYTEQTRTNLVIVDVFPYINDTAITKNLDGVRLPRGSQFADSFDPTRQVSVNLPGYSVQYYNSDSPIVYGTGTTEEVLDGLAWTSTPAANTIAIRIVQDAGVELGINELLQVIVPMKAPNNDDFSLSGLRAYNTFVRKDDSTVFDGVNRYLEPNRVYNRIPMPTVNIALTKVGVDPADYLQGAVFELRDSDGLLVRRETSDVDGRISMLNIDIGDYTLSEVQAPTGYKLLPNPIIITQQEMIDAYKTGIALDLGLIHNIPNDPDPIKGSVILEKLDKNRAPLLGFEFTIEGLTPAGTDQPGNTHIKMVAKSNAQGRIIFNNLPKGEYRITETRPAVPFLPVPPFTTEITFNGQVIEFTGDHAIINDRVALRVNKLGVLPDTSCANDPIVCNNQSGSLLPGAKFSIYVADGTTLLDGPLTTNDQGYVAFPGEGHAGLEVNTRYILREVEGVAGYTPYTEDIPFMFNERGKLFFCESADSCTTPFEQGQIYVPNIRIPQTGRVTVLKLEVVIPKGNATPQENAIQNVLAGAEFTIYRQSASNEWEFVETITSGTDGLATSSILPSGVYKIKETKAPLGYARSPLEETFVINPYPLPGEPLLLEFHYHFDNWKLGLDLKKYEMIHRNITYADAVDLLAAMAESCPSCEIVTTDFYYPLPSTPGETIVHIVKPLDMVNFALLDENKNPLETGVTGYDGWLRFSYDQIDETKTYYLREMSTPPGYQPILNDIPVRIGDYTSNPNFYGKIRVPVENKLQLGQISVSKYNLPHKTGMSGVTFELTGPLNNPEHTSEVRTAITDNIGYITWQNLPFGSYTLKEIATPEGYVLDPTVHEITITADNPHRYIVVYNKNIRDIKITKVLRGSEPPVFLPGAVFALYLPGETEPLGTSTTDTDGFATFMDVVYGDYILKEIKAPPGYRLNNVEIPVTVDDFLKPIITYTVEDSPIDENLPDTGTLSALGYLLSGMMLLATGFWFSKRWAKTHR